MPGPTRTQQKLIARDFCHQVEIARPRTPVWTALDCYATWLAIRSIGRSSLDHHRTWSKQIFPEQITVYGFREADEAEAFRRFVAMIAPLDDVMLRQLREAMASALQPHLLKPHST